MVPYFGIQFQFRLCGWFKEAFILEIRNPTAWAAKSTASETRFTLVSRQMWDGIIYWLLLSTWTTTDIFFGIFPQVCWCHRTPALHQRGFVHVVRPINSHVTKANKGDFSPKCIQSVNSRVNKSGQTLSLTNTLIWVTEMYSEATDTTIHDGVVR